ncbi:MAG: hypothetical protein AAGA75_01615 [Cyanobacteria bacterium P01_E01_bin.6]
MTPAEAIIASTFSRVSVVASILGDRVILRTRTTADANYITQNCDALLPPLELIRAPMLVYLHCTETNTYQEIGTDMMRIVSDLNDNRQK